MFMTTILRVVSLNKEINCVMSPTKTSCLSCNGDSTTNNAISRESVTMRVIAFLAANSKIVIFSFHENLLLHTSPTCLFLFVAWNARVI